MRLRRQRLEVRTRHFPKARRQVLDAGLLQSLQLVATGQFNGHDLFDALENRREFADKFRLAPIAFGRRSQVADYGFQEAAHQRKSRAVRLE